MSTYAVGRNAEQRALSRRRALLGLGGGLLGCAPLRSSGPPPPAEAELPRDAHEIALGLVDASVSAFYHVDRAQHSRVAEIVRTLDVTHQVLDRTGLEPREHLLRVFGAAVSTSSWDAITVFEHDLDETQVWQVLRDACGRAPERRSAEMAFPSASCEIGHAERVMAAPRPGLLVVAPTYLAPELGSFTRSGGLPLPTMREAAVLWSRSPELHVSNWPLRSTMPEARITARLRDAGGADIQFTGQCLDAAQATADADELTRWVEDSRNVDLWLTEMELVGKPKIRADGDRVIGDLHVTEGELEWATAVMIRGLPI